MHVRADAELSFVVRDNGSIIKDAGCRSGLGNLEQRATKPGGSFRVESAARGGTEFDWRVPPVITRKPVPGG